MRIPAVRSSRHHRRGALLAAAAAMLLVAVQASAVLAHAELVSSTPGDGTELATSPAEIRLVFSEAPALDSLSVRLFDRRGTEIALGRPSVGPYPTTILIPVPTALSPGPYTVVWFTVSAEDAHPEAKQFVFGVGEPAGAPSVTAGQLTGGGGPLVPLATLLAITGLTVMIGAAFQASALRLTGARVVGAAIGGSALFVGSMVTAAAGAPRGAATISDGSSGLLRGVDPADLARIALVGVFLTAVAMGSRLAPGRRRQTWLLALGVGIALAWLHETRSHAAGVGILPWVGVAWSAIDASIADPGRYAWFSLALDAARQLNVVVAAAHTVAVGVWIGGLLVASVYRFERDELAAWHPRFSRIAFVAFLVVAATGVYQAVLYLPAPDALVATDYGRVLIAKHVFVVGVMAMAGLNRFVAGPALRRATELARPARLAVRTLRVEAVMGIAVLAVTGVLATTATARPATSIFARPDIVARLGDRVVELAGDRAGATLTVAPLSATRQRFSLTGVDLALAPAAALTLANPAAGIERALPLRRDGSVWQADGLALPRDGVWVASVPLADRSDVSFRFEVAFGRLAARDDAARQIWDRAIERTETGLRSARMIDQLTDGLSLILFGYHEFVAPDRERFDIEGRFSSVTVNGQRFSREAGAATWTVRPTGSVGVKPPGLTGNAPGSWPWFGFLHAAVGVRLEGEASQAGQPSEVLVGIDPQSDVTYEIWVGRDDGMIQRLVMGLPGHYMVNAYFDVNAPIDIEPPDGPITPPG